jgi:hypothetical protein
MWRRTILFMDFCPSSIFRVVYSGRQLRPICLSYCSGNTVSSLFTCGFVATKLVRGMATWCICVRSLWMTGLLVCSSCILLFPVLAFRQCTLHSMLRTPPHSSPLVWICILPCAGSMTDSLVSHDNPSTMIFELFKNFVD